MHGLFFNTIVEIFSVSVHVALGYNFSDPNVLPWGFPSDSEGLPAMPETYLGASLVGQRIKCRPAMQETWV